MPEATLFTPVLEPAGEIEKIEFSIFDPPNECWIGLVGDLLMFAAPEPVRLHTLFPDADAGTEAHARRVLAWIREANATGEIVAGHVLHMSEHEVARAAIFQVRVQVPVFQPTGLEIDTDFTGEEETFEVRGAPDVVEQAVRRYRARYPEAIYGTRVTQHLAGSGQRRVRIVRSRVVDLLAPAGEEGASGHG